MIMPFTSVLFPRPTRHWLKTSSVMRVLFPFGGSTVGGSHVSAIELVKELRARDVEPVVVLHNPSGALAPWLARQGIVYQIQQPSFQPGRREWTLIKGLRATRHLLESQQIDLVHGNDREMNRFWALWAWSAGVPMVWHERGGSLSGMRTLHALKLAKGVISISTFVAESLPRLACPHETIFNPVKVQTRDLAATRIQLRQELGVRPDARLVGCFGNAKVWKRPDTVVEAAAICKSSAPDVHFVWFGEDRDGSLAGALSRNASARNGRMSPAVQHLPFRHDVYSAMAGCDVVVSASEGEPFGRSVAEAMGLGLPVVVSDSGGHREIVSNGVDGLFFPVGDAAACARAILQVLSDETVRVRQGEAARRSAGRFDPARHGQLVSEFYKRVLAR
jgi:glycosyltransferase involved in cell wall biosynthesis